MQSDVRSMFVIWKRNQDRLRSYLELTKPEVTSLVVISTLAGFYLASQGSLDLVLLLHTLAGTALVAGGTAAFNQFFERGDDVKMRRTANRPIPAGRVQPSPALWFAAIVSAAGILYLALAVNFTASLLASLTWGSYLFCYTPLKKRTTLCTAVGALPGAMPPLIGWAAARNALSAEAWVLYAILFFWQFPHFLSIAWMYREDYARAGIRMLPVVDASGKATGRQMVLCSLALLPVSLAPTLLGMTGTLFLGGSLVLGFAFLYFSVQAALTPSNVRARRLLQASVIYLPFLFALLMVDKR